MNNHILHKNTLLTKIVTTILLAALLIPMFTACQNQSTPGKKSGLSIVTTIFPEYDWVVNLLGSNPANADVRLLLDGGVDLHSYEPSVEDILEITRCDIFIYVGGESDEWAEDVVKNAKDADITVINLMDVLGGYVREEELVEGMEGEEEEGGDEEEGPEYDEHVWLSLRNAKIACAAIEEALEQKDPANASAYKTNLENYTKKLDDLDKEYANSIEMAPLYTLLFADRFPFRYLVDDYNLDYYAAFVGCSSESEASFETVHFLANKVDELGLPVILTIEGNNHKIAETVLSQTKNGDSEILSLDSMQSTTIADVNKGADYIKIMQGNLDVIRQALGSTLNPYDANSTTAMLSNAPAPEDELPEITSTIEGIDIDLPSMSSTVVYAQVYDMISNPDKYIGKTVRMSGTFGDYYDVFSKTHYYGCIVKDATACCAQGIEFVPVSDYKYPDDYPEVEDEITVIGTFSTYTEGSDLYCTLKDAVFE